MSEPKRTPFYEQHVAAGAKMVEFGGWEMPVQYPTGIVEEHLGHARRAGAVRRLAHGPLHRPRRRAPCPSCSTS